VASILTPYRSSDGNNPYTEEQLKRLWKDLEPKAREPGKYTPQEKLYLQREFLSYIQAGYTPTRACTRIKDRAAANPSIMPYADYGTFMAWKSFDKDFAEAYEVAYAMGTDNLEDKGVEMAYSGNASMLQFLLKARSPRYGNKDSSGGPGGSLQIETVTRIEIVAATAKPLEIEHDEHEGRASGPVGEIEDAEVIEDGNR